MGVGVMSLDGGMRWMGRRTSGRIVVRCAQAGRGRRRRACRRSGGGVRRRRESAEVDVHVEGAGNHPSAWCSICIQSRAWSARIVGRQCAHAVHLVTVLRVGRRLRRDDRVGAEGGVGGEETRKTQFGESLDLRRGDLKGLGRSGSWGSLSPFRRSCWCVYGREARLGGDVVFVLHALLLRTSLTRRWREGEDGAAPLCGVRRRGRARRSTRRKESTRRGLALLQCSGTNAKELWWNGCNALRLRAKTGSASWPCQTQRRRRAVAGDENVRWC
jgi:hypothetical protein